jgi:hypothetical protein
MPWAKEDPTELPDDDVRQHVLQVRVLELLRDIEPPPPASQGHVLRAEPATASAAAAIGEPSTAPAGAEVAGEVQLGSALPRPARSWWPSTAAELVEVAAALGELPELLVGRQRERWERSI